MEISSEPRRGSVRFRTYDGLRIERLLIDQIGSDDFAAALGIAFPLRQAREQSDFRLAEEKESHEDLLREQSARDAAVAALVGREELLA